jgi:membrane-bound ClpP family serine protease
MVIASLVLASMTSNWIDSSTVAFAELRSSMSIVVGSGAGILVFGMLARRYLPHAPMFNRVMLAPPEGQELAELSDRESMVDYDHLLDQQGQTTTQLTPSGKARIGNELIDVIADGEVIELGATIEVVEVRGNRVVVRSV